MVDTCFSTTVSKAADKGNMEKNCDRNTICASFFFFKRTQDTEHKTQNRDHYMETRRRNIEVYFLSTLNNDEAQGRHCLRHCLRQSQKETILCLQLCHLDLDENIAAQGSGIKDNGLAQQNILQHQRIRESQTSSRRAADGEMP